MARRSRRRCPRLRRASEALLLVVLTPASGAIAGAPGASFAPGDMADAAFDPAPAADPGGGGGGGGSGAVQLPLGAASAAAAANAAALMLAVTVNGVDKGLAPFTLVAGEVWGSPQVLRELGLVIPDNGDRPVPLGSVPGVTVTYRAELQQIDFMARADRLGSARERVNIFAPARPVAASARGLLLNYDLFASLIGSRTSLDAWNELRYFDGNSVFDTTSILRAGGGGGIGNRSVRLDTVWSTSFPGQRLTVRVGDTLTVPSAWSRSTRMGGIQIGTNNALQPYLVTAPLPSFFGSATLPSTLDLYINGIRRYTGEVAPGPFEVGAGPGRIDGYGAAQVVLTDAFGRATTMNFSLYDTSQLLRGGLADWSVEAGAVRENYGLRSFSYDDRAFFSGNWRRGMTDRLTVETHGEAATHFVNAGLGFAWLMGAFGVLSGSAAASNWRGSGGQQFGLGYSWTDGRFRIAAQAVRASSGYSDLAGMAGTPPTRERDYVQVGYTSRVLGSLSAGYVGQRYRGYAASRFATFNWYRSLGRQLSLSFSASQDIEERHRRTFFASLTFSLGRRDHFTASVRGDEDSSQVQLGARRSVPQKGGLGWNGDVWIDGEDVAAAGGVTYLGPYGETTLGGSVRDDYRAGYVGQRGSLVLMGDGLYPARTINDGFALVSTDGVSGVPIRLHNQQVGVTDGSGKLLVTGLNAYQRNVIAIDATDLPADYAVERLGQDAVPADRAGVAVKFPLRRVHGLLLTVVDGSGKVLAPGSRVQGQVQGGADIVVGFDGQLYLEDAAPGAVLVIDTPQGACHITLPGTLPDGVVANMGRVSCAQ